MPPISRVASSAGVDALQPLAHLDRQAGPEVDRVERARQHLGAHRVVAQHVGQQALEVEHLDAAIGERVRERVVLLAGAADPEDVVEQQRVLVVRREPLELEVGAVQDHAPQHPDLGAHVQAAWRPQRASPAPTRTFGSSVDRLRREREARGAWRACHQRIPT